MSDYLSNLLNKKQSFPELFQKVQQRFTRFKQQNDSLQRNCDMDMDQSLIQLISQQRTQMQQYHKLISLSKEMIQQIRDSITTLEAVAKGFDQKKQIKTFKSLNVKEVERNRQIMRSLVQKSFGSFQDDEEEQDPKEIERFLQIFLFKRQVQVAFPEYSDALSPSDYLKINPTQVLDINEQRIIFKQIEFDSQLIKERQFDLDHLTNESRTLQTIMNQLALKVDEQDGDLDIITSEMINTKKNIIDANKELLGADKISKQSNKKYIIIVLILFLLTSALVGSLFYFDYIVV